MRSVNTKYMVGLLAFLITACVTVNIYFPAAEVKQAAEDIAKDVRGSQQDQDLEKGPTSWLFFESQAYAAGELTVSNATIRQLKVRMKARYPSLAPYLKGGFVGEGANGLLVIRSDKGLGLKKKAELKRLVNAENSDRMALYRAVAQSLNIPSSQIVRVQKIFATEWQKTAPRGTFIQRPSGSWVRK